MGASHVESSAPQSSIFGPDHSLPRTGTAAATGGTTLCSGHPSPVVATGGRTGSASVAGKSKIERC